MSLGREGFLTLLTFDQESHFKFINFKSKGFQNCSGFTVIIFNFVLASHHFSPERLRQFPRRTTTIIPPSKTSSNRGAHSLRLNKEASSEPLNRNRFLSRKGMKSNRSSGQAERSASVIRLCRRMSPDLLGGGGGCLNISWHSFCVHSLPIGPFSINYP